MRTTAAVSLVAVIAACGTTSADSPGAHEVIDVPARMATAGDALLELAPSGAALVAELDIARLRANQAVGPAIEALAAIDVGAARLGLGFNVVNAADAVLFCAYAIGADDASSITLLRGPGVAALEVGTLIGDDTRAIGPEELVARAVELETGAGSSVADDRALLRVRTLAMPEQAPSASLRVTARLDFEARVALANRLGLDAVPVSLSIWGDVVDDLAIVALMAASDANEAVDLVRAARAWRDRLADQPWARSRMLHLVLRDIAVERRGQSARAVLLIGPRRLESLMKHVGPAPEGKE